MAMWSMKSMASSVGQMFPWSSVTDSLDLPRRDVEAGGKRRRVSLITAVVYCKELTALG